MPNLVTLLDVDKTTYGETEAQSRTDRWTNRKAGPEDRCTPKLAADAKNIFDERMNLYRNKDFEASILGIEDD